MPKKEAKSSFMSRVAEAHEQHKNDETKMSSGGELPGGIEHGVAKLVDVHIGVYQKGDYEGEPFFMAAGTVLEPKTHLIYDQSSKKSRAVNIFGLRTQIGPIPLCDTTDSRGNQISLADHWETVLNHLRLLGVDTKTVEPDDIITEDNGVYGSGPVLEALSQSGITFRFRTWQGKATQQYPNPRVNHDWRGAVEYEDTEAPEAVEDDTAEPEQGETPQWEQDAQAEEAASAPEPEQDEPEAEPAQETSDPDLGELGRLADEQDDKDAQSQLIGLAKLHGIDYEAPSSWSEVALLILQAEAGELQEVQPETEWEPIEGEIGLYTPPKAKKPVVCEFGKVFSKAKKVNITVDGKVIKAVSFDQVQAG